MILTGNEDLRIKRTITSIKESFEELICEKDFEKITVKELCDTAMINKKTFYQYYEDMYALLAEMQMELSRGYVERVKGYKLPDDLAKVNREFFIYSEEQGEAYEKITCSFSYAGIRQDMIDAVVAATWEKSRKFNSLDSLHQGILLNYINNTTLEIYRQWIGSGKKLPLEEVIRLSEIFVTEGTNGYFKSIKEK